MTTEAVEEIKPAIRTTKGMRCWKCGQVFIDYMSAPYRYVCRHKECRAVNEEK